MASCLSAFFGILSWLKPTVYYQLDMVLLGFPNSGKTSLVDALTRGTIDDDMVPTTPFDVKKFTLNLSNSALNYQRKVVRRHNEQIQKTIRRTRSSYQMSLRSNSNGNYDTVSPTLPSTSLSETDPLLNDEYEVDEEEVQYYPEKLHVKCYDLSGQVKYRDTLWKEYICGIGKCNLIVYMIDVSDELNIVESRNTLIDILLLNNDLEKGGQRLPVLIIGNKMDLVTDNFHSFLGRFTTTNTGSTTTIAANPTAIVADKPRKRRTLMIGSQYKIKSGRKNKVLGSNASIASKLRISKSDILAQFLGLEMSFTDEQISLRVNENGIHRLENLQFDIGIFTISLKQMGQGYGDGEEMLANGRLEDEISTIPTTNINLGVGDGYDQLDDIKDWIFGVN